MESGLPFVERMGRIYRQVAPRVAADILVYTPEEWERMRERPFFGEALLTGKVPYEKNTD